MPDFYAQEIWTKAPKYFFGRFDDIFIIPFLRLLGIPTSMDDYHYLTDGDGVPLQSECLKKIFAQYYITSDVMSLFRAIYHDYFGMQQTFINYWGAVVDRLGSNPYVIGTDPLNEPFPVGRNLLDFINMITPGKGDKALLAPMYSKIYERVKYAGFMSFEEFPFPDTLGLTLGPWQILRQVFPVGFEKPPGGEIGSNNHALNFHSYCCTLGPDVCAATGEPPAHLESACYDWHRMKFDQREDDAIRLGIPSIITEFGACMGSPECITEIRQITDLADDHLVSWAYWQYKTFQDPTTTAGTGSEGLYNPDGSIQGDKAQMLARTYIQSAQGTIQQNKFDTNTATFSATFEFDSSIDAPTVIYVLNESVHGEPVWYPDGAKLYLADDRSQPIDESLVTFGTDVGPNRLEFKLDSSLDRRLIKILVEA